jgi:hypothetical protein
MKLFIFALGVIVLIYALSGGQESNGYVNDNYGQYDKGTALCDKGAYGDVNGLCN